MRFLGYLWYPLYFLIAGGTALAVKEEAGLSRESIKELNWLPAIVGTFTVAVVIRTILITVIGIALGISWPLGYIVSLIITVYLLIQPNSNRSWYIILYSLAIEIGLVSFYLLVGSGFIHLFPELIYYENKALAPFAILVFYQPYAIYAGFIALIFSLIFQRWAKKVYVS